MTDGRPPDDLAVLVHEIRSPVAALVAIAAAYPVSPPDRQAQLLKLARSAVGSIERLLTEPQAEKLRVERVDLGRLVLDATQAAMLPLGKFPVGAGFSLGTMVQDDLIVDGDPVRLRQLLDNLIGNAMGHSQSIEVSARRDGALIVVEVSDEGDGIPAADLERMFELGVRLTNDRPGSGLGLAVVRTIARAHGGEVEVESTPGQGATFRLVLPGASGAP
jgi:two-component system sensor histidine kinase MtrB